MNSMFKLSNIFMILLGNAAMALGIVILIGQMLFSDKEAILYGILLVMTYTIVLDKVLVFGRAQIKAGKMHNLSEEYKCCFQQIG